MRAAGAQAFDRHDRLVLKRADRRLARTRRPAVDVHRARAAQPGAAPEAGAGQTEIVTEMPEQRHLRIAVEGARRSVDLERDHASLAYRGPPQLRTHFSGRTNPSFIFFLYS